MPWEDRTRVGRCAKRVERGAEGGGTWVAGEDPCEAGAIILSGHLRRTGSAVARKTGPQPAAQLVIDGRT